MKKLWIPFVCIMLAVFVSAGAEVTVTDTLSGVMYWPDDQSADQAIYTYSYAYPYVSGDEDVAGTINETFEYLVEDAEAFTVPMKGEELSGEISSYTEVNSVITYLSDEWLSILITQHEMLDGYEHISYHGYTFPLTGGRAGSVTSLPRVLGILKDDESDTWMQDRQTAKANDLVWSLVWDEIQEQNESGEIVFYDGLDYETLTYNFYPEEDFYMNDQGEIVFFIQAGFLADESYGILTYTYDIEDLKDEL